VQLRAKSLVILGLGIVLGRAQVSFGQASTSASGKRPVTVADAIEMTRIAGSPYPAVRPKTGFAEFSPDGSRFAIVLSKGNLRQNTNDYSLLVFRTAQVSRGGQPQTLVSFSSSSNLLGIQNLTWSEDNDTIYFLGARGEEVTELYSIRCSSGKLTKLTNHPTALRSYTVSDNDGTIAFTAEPAEHALVTADVLQNGFHVAQEAITDLIRGRIHDDFRAKLFVKSNMKAAERQLATMGPLGGGYLNSQSLSPDGRFLVVKTETTDVPTRWSEYEDPDIQTLFRRTQTKGFRTGFLRYELVDTQTGVTHSVLDSPASSFQSDVIWSPDSASFLLCGVFLPLSVNDPLERQARRSKRFVVEISLPNRTITSVASADLSPVRWDKRTNTVEFQGRQSLSVLGSMPKTIYYRKRGELWEAVTDSAGRVANARPDIVAEQDLNVPPKIIAVDPRTRQKTVLLDLNPEFAGLTFGKVEEISLRDKNGSQVNGALYLPPDYVVGRRYPLVIQTHGFEPHTFSIDGPHPTAAAAQPLASMDIVVFQIKDIFPDSLDTVREPERAASAYQTAVEFFDQKGVIDSRRVGLMGFSRTCLYVKYALTQLDQRFSAAVIADGLDAGYFQYLMFYNIDPAGAEEFESIIGGSPFGSGLSLWLKRSPGFLLDKVHTPVQIQALGRESILDEWEWFEGLKRLDRPVDLIYIPTGTHILVKPWERLTSQEGAVDWFRFWLKGEEDPNPTKAEQYKRWRELQKLQEKSSTTSGNPN
jgi:dipeptidyl aminopeptidase/acylaminoacyl peptidase